MSVFFKRKCSFSVHVFRPTVDMELGERCRKRQSKLIMYSINTTVQIVMLTQHQSHLTKACWGKPPPNGSSNPQNNPGCDLNHNRIFNKHGFYDTHSNCSKSLQNLWLYKHIYEICIFKLVFIKATILLPQ